MKKTIICIVIGIVLGFSGGLIAGCFRCMSCGGTGMTWKQCYACGGQGGSYEPCRMCNGRGENCY